MIYTLCGHGCIDDGGHERELTQGDILLYSPEAYQSYRTSPDGDYWDLAWAHFQPRAHWMSLLRWPRWGPGIAVLRLAPGEARDGFTAAVQQMVAMARRPSSSAIAFALNCLEECLLWADLVAREDPSLQIDPRIRQTMDDFAQNLSDPFCLTAAARKCGLSPTHFSHLFKKHTGRSPQQFSEELRIAQATFLLRESKLAIADIANQCGYDDPLYFSRRFRRRTGLSPAKFRLA